MLTVAGLGIVVNSFIDDTANAVIGSIIIALGVPVFLVWRRVTADRA